MLRRCNIFILQLKPQRIKLRLQMLKGQCHEMVVKMSPQSSNLGLNRWSHTFFLFKNRLFQSYGPYSSTSIDVKTGSPDLADFAKTWSLLPRLWHIALRRLRYAKVAQTMAQTANIRNFFAQTATSL
jgi:hypothetical protein